MASLAGSIAAYDGDSEAGKILSFVGLGVSVLGSVGTMLFTTNRAEKQFMKPGGIMNKMKNSIFKKKAKKHKANMGAWKSKARKAGKAAKAAKSMRKK